MNGPGIEPRVALERALHQVLHLAGRAGPAASTGPVLKVALLSTGLALGALMTLCLCASVAGIHWGGFLVEQSQIQAVLHIALGLMRDGELDQAHALFATMAQSRAL